MTDPRVFYLRKALRAYRSGPADLRRRAGQLHPAGLVRRNGSRGDGDTGFDRGRAAGRVPPFRLLELTAVLGFPLLTVTVGHKPIPVPESAGGRLDRFL